VNDVTPEEFGAYYDAKIERLEEMGDECNWRDCDESVRWPCHYCSPRHRQYGLRLAAVRVGLSDEDPDSIGTGPKRTPTEMQLEIATLRRQIRDCSQNGDVDDG
jgi:hypothetical protein